MVRDKKFKYRNSELVSKELQAFSSATIISEASSPFHPAIVIFNAIFFNLFKSIVIEMCISLKLTKAGLHSRAGFATCFYWSEDILSLEYRKAI